jgi:hypothetical protein
MAHCDKPGRARGEEDFRQTVEPQGQGDGRNDRSDCAKVKHRTAPACVDRGGEEVEAAKPPAGESCTLRIFVGVEDSEDGQLAVRREFPQRPRRR